MKFLLCVLFIFIVVYKIKAFPLFEYDIYPSILVHEEHNNVGSASRRNNVPSDIYDIVNHIIEVQLKDILNNGQINSNGGEMEIIIVPPSGLEIPDIGDNMENQGGENSGGENSGGETPGGENMENPDGENIGNAGEEENMENPGMETPTSPSNNTETTTEIPTTTSTEATSTEKPIETPPTTVKVPETTTLPATTETPSETTVTEETTAGTTILPQTLPFEIITTEPNVPETTTNEITTEINEENVPRILREELSDDESKKEDVNDEVETFDVEGGEKRDVKAIREKQTKNIDQVLAASELRNIIKLITFDSRFLRRHS